MCHGDIKTENILVTSWTWVLLADLASFKPVFVPADNPADFNFFFDTSRRRTCYLAPERFLDANRSNVDTSNIGSSGDESIKGDAAASQVLPLLGFPSAHQFELKEAMDIFSVGYVWGTYSLYSFILHLILHISL